jgi:hypothetical protein
MVGGRQHLGQVQRLARNGRISLISAGCKIYILVENFAVQDRPGEIVSKKCGGEKL